jgi:Holliday junction resolvase RusA-like endonuclease
MKLVISGNIPSQKNRKVIAHKWVNGKKVAFLRSDDVVLEWKAEAIRQLREQFKGYKITDYPVECVIVFYFGNLNRHDLDNAAAGVMDALTAAGVIEDDNVKFINSLTLSYGGHDKNNPRAEIYFDE